MDHFIYHCGHCGTLHFIHQEKSVSEVKSMSNPIKEDNDKPPDLINITENLIEIHVDILKNVRYKLDPYL